MLNMLVPDQQHHNWTGKMYKLFPLISNFNIITYNIIQIIYIAQLNLWTQQSEGQSSSSGNIILVPSF